MALNGLYCADVPLSNCSLTHASRSKGYNPVALYPEIIESGFKFSIALANSAANETCVNCSYRCSRRQKPTSIQLLRAWTVLHHSVDICATHGPWNNRERFCSVHRLLTCVLLSGCYTHQPKALPNQHPSTQALRRQSDFSPIFAA